MSPAPDPDPIANPEDLLGTYSFLPWLRQGVANAINGPAAGPRATIDVELQLSGTPIGGGGPLTQPIPQNIELFGPGDIIGIEGRAVVRTEPRDWVTNFESNYLAAIDFYDEDLPWRYTPAPPQGLQLLPWLALVVLQEGEFAEAKNIAGRPLPFVTVTAAGVFPPSNQTWAWAHVHFNQSLSGGGGELVSPDMTAVLPRVQNILATNPDLAYSRLLCPRRLDVNTGYHAFLMPAFESGRLAGLGLPVTPPSATAAAWDKYAGQPEPQNFPYYYRWYFRTGDRGDFRYLVGLLKPQPVDKTVGTRDFDSTSPGSGVPGVNKPELGGVLRLGGALQVPDADLNDDDLAERQKFEDWDQPYPDDFEKGLAQFINLSDDYSRLKPQTANAATSLEAVVTGSPDPLITSPLYGRWHSLTQRLLTNPDGTDAPNRTNWVHRLNLDPRFRIPANFGTEVIEQNAEEYMNYAWEQIGDVLAANFRIRRLHFATAASSRMFDRHLLTVADQPQRVLSLTAPVTRRVLFTPTAVAGAAAPAPVTVASLSKTTLVPPVLTSTMMRRVTRPGGRLMRQLPFTATLTPGKLLERVNAGQVTSAPPKTVPPGVVTVDTVAGAAIPQGAPPMVLNWLKQYAWLPLAVLIAGVVLALLIVVLSLGIGIPIAVAIAGFAVYVFRLLQKWRTAETASTAASEAGQTPGNIANLPTSANFVLSDPGSSFRPTLGGADSQTAARFKAALKDSFALAQAGSKAAQLPPRVALDLKAVSATMISGIDPKLTILRRGITQIALPPWVISQIGSDFNEVMAYPRIDLPMYKPLAVKVERLLPNINKIAHNSITLMETNERFIESYMVGLNHEFARKLLWREYPTDQRGSCFRQFWAVDNYIDSEGLSHDALQEKLYDIPKIHLWPLTNPLGANNNRADPANPTAAQVVLIIRGELLKKYPNTVIFAQHAKMVNQLRTPDWLTADEEKNPPRSKTRSPLFSANPVDDIFFFGFDLTIDQVKGTGGDPGWYFVLQERPGEARFGLELTRDALETFDEVTWDDAMPGGHPGDFLRANVLGNVPLTAPVNDPANADKIAQFQDDSKVNVAPISSARWADLLFRQPVMVAVHADEMLRENRA